MPGTTWNPLFISDFSLCIVSEFTEYFTFSEFSDIFQLSNLKNMLFLPLQMKTLAWAVWGSDPYATDRQGFKCVHLCVSVSSFVNGGDNRPRIWWRLHRVNVCKGPRTCLAYHTVFRVLVVTHEFHWAEMLTSLLLLWGPRLIDGSIGLGVWWKCSFPPWTCRIVVCTETGLQEAHVHIKVERSPGSLPKVSMYYIASVLR